MITKTEKWQIKGYLQSWFWLYSKLLYNLSWSSGKKLLGSTKSNKSQNVINWMSPWKHKHYRKFTKLLSKMDLKFSSISRSYTTKPLENFACPQEIEIPGKPHFDTHNWKQDVHRKSTFFHTPFLGHSSWLITPWLPYRIVAKQQPGANFIKQAKTSSGNW